METVTATNYCRVCGKVSPGSVCDGCGCNPYAGNAYCNNCGQTSIPQAMMCPNCKNYFPPQDATPYMDNFEDLGVNSKTKINKRAVLIGTIIIGLVFVIFHFVNKKQDVDSLRASINDRMEVVVNENYKLGSAETWTWEDWEKVHEYIEDLEKLKADIDLLSEMTKHQEDVSTKLMMVNTAISSQYSVTESLKKVLEDRGILKPDYVKKRENKAFEENMMNAFSKEENK